MYGGYVCSGNCVEPSIYVAYHNPYTGGLHSQPVLQAYATMLECVYSPKSDENGCFHHFSRYFTLKALARRLYMLRELWRVFNMAEQKPYKGGLNPVLQTYTMTL